MHYKVALLEADGKYNLAKGENQGDSGDLWSSNSVLSELTAGTGGTLYPNTDTYQFGDIVQTGIRIYGFSDSGNGMTFSVEGLGQESVMVLGLESAALRLEDMEQSGDESTESIFALRDASDDQPAPTAQPTPQLKRKRRHRS